ncbi:alkaline phosphatase family protein [Francisella salimarina]|uniref:alkaline phosphatase family protein n=1 Tax=Francisella salimarina TaxID=2599927 RepID=UPI0037510995
MKLNKITLGILSISIITTAFASGVNNSKPNDYGNLVKVEQKLFNNANTLKTTTPIKHLVIIFQENNSFDRYFGMYPNAKNPEDEPKFIAKEDTPSVNGLTKQLLENNPNTKNPYRLDRNFQPCSQNHEYHEEISSFNGGLMNKFVEHGGHDNDTYKQNCDGQVMGYYDGNTVTALWNYAQNFALNDNTFGTTFGPSTPGALNLVAGANGPAMSPSGNLENIENSYIIEDPNPYYDDCSYGTSKSGDTNTAVAKITDGKNIGHYLTQKGITWGWFQGGFKPTSYSGKTAICDAMSTNKFGVKSRDYIPHHEPFNYWKETSNPHHLAPSDEKYIGSNDQANHQYDISEFWKALDQNNMPAVSYLKAPGYQDGHGGYSNPLDEQEWLVNTINRIEQSKDWDNTAIIIIYDDSDGDYDHVYSPKSQFNDIKGRQGYGPRLPMLVISPYAKANYVDHSLLNQASVLKFVEYNWGIGSVSKYSNDKYSNNILSMFDFGKKQKTPKLILDPKTGTEIK